MRAFTRKIHSLPKIKHTAAGVPGLFSKDAFQVAWTDHQTDLLAKLSQAALETDNEARVPFHILLNTAADSSQAHTFNYASQAHNNHLFFETLGSGSIEHTRVGERINQAFGSPEGLFEAICNAAETVPGNGWVFLVETPDKTLKVQACQNAGTPYHFSRAQSVDLNGQVSADDARVLSETVDLVANKEKNWNIALLALNLWQHAYLIDYGVAGRDEYMRSWWGAIDWKAVDSRLYKY